jgi:hypothetical protein
MGVSGQRHSLGKGPPGTRWIGGRVGLRAGLDTEEQSFTAPCEEGNKLFGSVQEGKFLTR